MKVLLFAVIIIAVCALLLWDIAGAEKAVRERKPNEGTYDERQMLARGRAESHALTALLLYLFADYLVSDQLGRSWAAPGIDAIIGAYFGLTVFTVESIFRGAYFRLGMNIKKHFGWMLVSGAASLGTLVWLLYKGSLIENGVVTQEAFYVSVFLCYVVIAAAAAIWMYREKRAAVEDDEDDGGGA